MAASHYLHLNHQFFRFIAYYTFSTKLRRIQKYKNLSWKTGKMDKTLRLHWCGCEEKWQQQGWNGGRRRVELWKEALLQRCVGLSSKISSGFRDVRFRRRFRRSCWASYANGAQKARVINLCQVVSQLQYRLPLLFGL